MQGYHSVKSDESPPPMPFSRNAGHGRAVWFPFFVVGVLVCVGYNTYSHSSPVENEIDSQFLLAASPSLMLSSRLPVSPSFRSSAPASRAVRAFPSSRSRVVVASALYDDQLAGELLSELTKIPSVGVRGVHEKVWDLSSTLVQHKTDEVANSPLGILIHEKADQIATVIMTTITDSGLLTTLHEVAQLIKPFLGSVMVIVHDLGLPEDAAVFALSSMLLSVAGKLTDFAGKLAVPSNEALLPETYDPEAIAGYYEDRPGLVLGRTAKILSISNGFLARLLYDTYTNNLDKNASKRAKDLVDIIVQLGPAFIKVAQGLSIRPDIVSEAYLVELQRLQDEVAPFASDTAKQIVERDLGSLGVFQSGTAFDSPVAAASIGQVYKAHLKDGTPVAVKVQRPDSLSSVTLDLYLIRTFLLWASEQTYLPKPFTQAFRDTCKGTASLIQAWASRFIDELDYRKEAAYANQFRENLKTSDLLQEDAILVPKTYLEYTTRYVTVSEWVEGVKLTAIDTTIQQGKEDLLRVVQVMVNCYLQQLLDTGLLHADPHPGNFFLTDDGRLCILDFGLMTEVTKPQQYAMLDYVSHLTAKEFDQTLDDLIIMGFLDPEVGANQEIREVVAPLLGNILEKLSAGGGAAALAPDGKGTSSPQQQTFSSQLENTVEDIAQKYPLIIPPYFALIIRAFSALEGLGLTADPNYSIVQSCTPYIMRRLLTDDSAQTRAMLRRFIYGNSKSTKLRVDRVKELAAGFTQFVDVAEMARSGQMGGQSLDMQLTLRGQESKVNLEDPTTSSTSVDKSLRDLFGLLLSPQGNYVQELLLDEAVRMTDALGRSQINTLLTIIMSPAALLEMLPSSTGDDDAPALASFSATSLGSTDLLKTFLSGLPQLPSLLLYPVQRAQEVVGLQKEDEETLEAFFALVEIITPLVNMQLQQAQNGGVSSSRPVMPAAMSAFSSSGRPDAAQLKQQQEEFQELVESFQGATITANSLSARFWEKLINRVIYRLTLSLDPPK